MKKRLLSILLLLLVALPLAAIADVTPEDANLVRYESLYSAQSEAYKLIRYGAEGERIVAVKEALALLGYFPYRVSDNYHRTLEIALRVFGQQMRIGGDGRVITPLVQAMLADARNLPKAVSPAIDVFPYSWEPNGTSYTAYSYARVNRTGVLTDTKVGFSGRIASAAKDGGTWYYAVEMEGDPAKVVYVSYQPLPRTTVFQPGDSVAVFGVTQGQQSLPYAGMQAGALLVNADRVGYAPE